MGIAGALIGTAVIGAGASVIAGGAATRAQTTAANQNTALQQAQDAEARRQYDLNRSDLAPYRAAGTGALSQLSTLMGIPQTSYSGGGATPLSAVGTGGQQGGYGVPRFVQDITGNWVPAPPATGIMPGAPGAQTGTSNTADPEFGSFNRAFGLADFQRDPGYDFRQQEGQRGVEASAAARGGILSGAALKAITRYNQDFASNEYGNAYGRYNNDQTTRFNRLSSLAGTGQTATSQGIASGNALTGQLQAGVNNITNNNNAIGNARASQYAGIGNAIGGLANTVGTYFGTRGAYAPNPGIS